MCRNTLHVDGLVVSCHGCLLHSLRESRVAVAHPRDIFGRRPVLHGDAGLVDHLARARRHDVAAEYLVGVLVGNKLHEPVGVAVGPGPGVGHHTESALLEVESLLLGLGFGDAHPRHLGVGVEDGGDIRIVDVPGFACEVLHAGDAVLFSLVGEHGPVDDVADSEHSGGRGLEVLVHNHAAALVGLHASSLQAEPVGEGPAAGGHEHDIDLHCLRVAALDRLHGQLHAAGGHLRRCDLGAKLEREALLLEGALHGAPDLGIHGGHDVIQELNHSHFGAETAPHAAHLQPDDAAADHDHGLGHGLEGEGARGGHDLLLIDRHAGEGRHLGPRGQHDVLRLDGLGGAVLLGDLHLPGAVELAPTLDVGDLVFLEEPLDALGEPGDGLVLGRHQLVNVEGDAGHVDAVLGHVVLSIVVHVAGVEERLGGDAADVEAGAAEATAALDAGHLHAELGGLDGTDIPARPAPDNDEILGLARGEAAGAEDAEHGAIAEGVGAHGPAANACQEGRHEKL
mmetsp:Transcript_31043/g.99107  ORF Transcript_31043/g.99107 Transcript_31043/m.99107 type:complete len:511 (-) Transcript_31043:619-2151(-)